MSSDEDHGFSQTLGTDPEAEAAELRRENDYLAKEIERLHSSALSKEEIDYIRKRMEQDARAVWAWQLVREYAPWVVGLLGAAGSALYWLLTHTVKIGPTP